MSDREDRSIAMSHVSLTDRRCPDCGEWIIDPGAHLERCVGPRAHGECDCPAGYTHLPDCKVIGDETA